jgi:methionyl-tRNA formyltransferase
LRVSVPRTRIEPVGGEPGTVLEVGRDRLVVAAGEGAIAILSVQPPGKKPMPVGDFLRGHRVQPGDRMGPEAAAGFQKSS